MNKTFKLAALSAVAFALAACGGGGDSDDGGNGPVVGRNGTVEVGSVNLSGGQSCNIPGFAQALIAEINAARAQARNCGANAIPAAPAVGYWNSRLSDAASRHSADMAATGVYSHTGSDGSSLMIRVDRAGYVGQSSEILMRVGGGGNTRDMKVWMNSWLGSSEHCSILMDPTVSEIGAACSMSGNTTYTTVVLGH